MRFLYIILNFIDTTLAIERVSKEGIEGVEVTGFTLSLRFLNTLIEYSIGYLIVKFIQFLISILGDRSIEDIPFAFVVIFPVFIIEIGSSKRPIWNTLNFALFLLRSTIKLIVFLAIDKVVIYLFA